MVKGLLIMLTVFLCIAILHFVSLRIINSSEKTKKAIRKAVWYFYGCYFLGYGIHLIAQNGFNLLDLLFVIIGLYVILLNYKNKFETHP